MATVRTPALSTMRKVMRRPVVSVEDVPSDEQDPDQPRGPMTGEAMDANGRPLNDHREIDQSTGALLGVKAVGQSLSGDDAPGQKTGQGWVGRHLTAAGQDLKQVDEDIKESPINKALGKPYQKLKRGISDFGTQATRERDFLYGDNSSSSKERYRKYYEIHNDDDGKTRDYGVSLKLDPKTMRHIEDDVNNVESPDQKSMTQYWRLQQITDGAGKRKYSDSDIEDLLDKAGEKVLAPDNTFKMPKRRDGDLTDAAYEKSVQKAKEGRMIKTSEMMQTASNPDTGDLDANRLTRPQQRVMERQNTYEDRLAQVGKMVSDANADETGVLKGKTSGKLRAVGGTTEGEKYTPLGWDIMSHAGDSGPRVKKQVDPSQFMGEMRANGVEPSNVNLAIKAGHSPEENNPGRPGASEYPASENPQHTADYIAKLMKARANGAPVQGPKLDNPLEHQRPTRATGVRSKRKQQSLDYYRTHQPQAEGFLKNFNNSRKK